jgi:oxygen-independent coproporphyrinogen-3 oxidase
MKQNASPKDAGQDHSQPLDPASIPLALYIHLPWCLHKCAYCDFNSHAADQPKLERYIHALLADLELESAYTGGRSLDTLFIGGGTPSLFPAPLIAQLLEGVDRLVGIKAGAEITIEANPGASDEKGFAGYHAAGVNRISIGVQSFHDPALIRLGRIHDAARAKSAVKSARAAGFRRINLDLMYGLEGQTPAQAEEDLRQAIALEVEHISRYQLTLEPGSELYRNPPKLPDDDAIAEMEERGEMLLNNAGYQRYEVSACAHPDEACRHNLNYWTFGDYLGIGAGAHGKITLPHRILRRRRLADPDKYLAQAGTPQAIPEQWQLDRKTRIGEFMLNALRLHDGFDPQLFPARTGLPLQAMQAPLQEAVRKELLTNTPHRIRPTPLGWRFLNDLIGTFL